MGGPDYLPTLKAVMPYVESVMWTHNTANMTPVGGSTLAHVRGVQEVVAQFSVPSDKFAHFQACVDHLCMNGQGRVLSMDRLPGRGPISIRVVFFGETAAQFSGVYSDHQRTPAVDQFSTPSALDRQAQWDRQQQYEDEALF